MRNRSLWLSAALCLVASGCAVAPRWPNAISALVTPRDTDQGASARSLIDAWGDEDELRPYERSAMFRQDRGQPDPQEATEPELEPDAEAEFISDSQEDLASEPVIQEPPAAKDEALAEPEPESTISAAPAAVTDSKPAVQPIDEAYLETVAEPYSLPTQYIVAEDDREGHEEIVTPPAAERSRFRYGDGEDDLDRFNRRVQDVPLDARPIEGTMPTPPEVAEHPDQPRWVDVEEGEGMPYTVVSYTPWTFCYRPLYFEEINLERYGCSAGLVQPALSGAHFFGSVALMPYKMAVWPPRSCVCSNGFSRCEDCRPRGYRECVWSWRAAAVEAGVIAGIAVSLPW